MPKHTTPRTCQHNPLQHRRTIHACDIARRGYNCIFHHGTRFHRIHAMGLGVSLKVPDTTLATASCKIQVSKRLNTCPSCSLSDEMRTATQPSILPTCRVRALGGRAMHRYTHDGAPCPLPQLSNPADLRRAPNTRCSNGNVIAFPSIRPNSRSVKMGVLPSPASLPNK